MGTRLETNHEYGKAVTVAAWTGADCSLRTCPSGYAWAAAPQDDQDHKQKLECSGKGTCDRKTGECKCFPGFNGEGCRVVHAQMTVMDMVSAKVWKNLQKT